MASARSPGRPVAGRRTISSSRRRVPAARSGRGCCTRGRPAGSRCGPGFRVVVHPDPDPPRGRPCSARRPRPPGPSWGTAREVSMPPRSPAVVAAPGHQCFAQVSVHRGSATQPQHLFFFFFFFFFFFSPPPPPPPQKKKKKKKFSRSAGSQHAELVASGSISTRHGRVRGRRGPRAPRPPRRPPTPPPRGRPPDGGATSRCTRFLTRFTSSLRRNSSHGPRSAGRVQPHEDVALAGARTRPAGEPRPEGRHPAPDREASTTIEATAPACARTGRGARGRRTRCPPGPPARPTARRPARGRPGCHPAPRARVTSSSWCAGVVLARSRWIRFFHFLGLGHRDEHQVQVPAVGLRGAHVDLVRLLERDTPAEQRGPEVRQDPRPRRVDHHVHQARVHAAQANRHHRQFRFGFPTGRVIGSRAASAPRAGRPGRALPARSPRSGTTGPTTTGRSARVRRP